MPNDALVRPLGKRNFTNKLRFGPDRAAQAGIFRYPANGRFFRAIRSSIFFNSTRSLIAEAGARATRINQFPLS